MPTPVQGVDSPADIRVHTASLIIGLACLVAVNILFIVDIELTLDRNSRTNKEDEWGFGQVLALLLLVVPLRDAWKALQDINHFQQQFEQLFQSAAEAKRPEEINANLSELVRQGADPRKPLSGPFTNCGEMATYYGKVELMKFLLEKKFVDVPNCLQMAADYGKVELVSLFLSHIKGDKHAVVNFRGTSLNVYQPNKTNHFQVKTMEQRFGQHLGRATMRL